MDNQKEDKGMRDKVEGEKLKGDRSEADKFEEDKPREGRAEKDRVMEPFQEVRLRAEAFQATHIDMEAL